MIVLNLSEPFTEQQGLKLNVKTRLIASQQVTPLPTVILHLLRQGIGFVIYSSLGSQNTI